MTDRIPLDDLTSDAYDALHAELEEARALLHDANGDRDSWYREAKTAEAEVDQLRVQRHTYRRAWNSAKNRARKERARAEQAEAKLAAFLRAALDEHQEQRP